MESPWRMPTYTQLQEFANNTTSQWTTINGVNGRKFINKSDSNKYIFLPACGYCDSATHRSAGSEGYYWSTGWSSSSYAWRMYFNSDSTRALKGYRYTGYSIRPIK